MTNLTIKEKIVFAAIVNQCGEDYSSSVKEIHADTSSVMDIATVKGVVGSLAAKGLIQAETEKRDNKTFKDIWPIFGGEVLCWGGENMSAEAYAAYEAYKATGVVA